MQQLEERSLKLLIDLLNESQIPDNVKQNEVHHKIGELSQNPEFCTYIVYILTLQNDPALNTVRKIAGATLKGVLERNWDKIPSQTLNYVKATLLKALDDPNPGIRNTVTNVIAALFSKTGFKAWPELFKFLEMNLENQSQEVVESALGCISKIFEDIKLNSENMDLTTDDNSNPFHNIIAKLMFMCKPDFPVSIRDVSLHSLNLFIAYLDSSLLDTYLQILVLYSEDVNPLLRKRSCEGFHDTYEARKEFILHNLETVLDRVLKFTMDENRDVRKAACRFWNEYLLTQKGESTKRIMILERYLEILIPVLIDCLHHSNDDLINSQTSQKDRLHQNYRDAYNEEEEASDEEEENQSGGWTLRKEAARALDFLARYFKERIFSFAQEKIAACLKDSNWVTKEAGMLCLGALAKGALKAILPHLTDLVPFLMESLSDKEPLVRCTSCWALSKFTGWIADQGRTNAEILKAYLIEILKRLLDEDSQVQESACTALSRLVVEDGQLIEPFLDDIIQVFKTVSEQYKKKSLANLFDTMSSLVCNIAKKKVQNPVIENTLMDIIAKQWNKSQFCDIESIYLVGTQTSKSFHLSLKECTDVILGALEDNAAKYVDFFLNKSLILIFNYIQARKTDDKKSVYHKKEIALRSFEVLSVFVKVLKLESERVINASDYQKLFIECADDPDIVVRQFILSSVGEVAKHCPNLLVGYVDTIANVLMRNLIVDTPEADPYDDLQASCNNTAWSVGEVALAFPTDFAKFTHEFAVRLCEIVTSGLVSQSRLKINLQLALGRLSLVDPDAVAPLLDRFLEQFCTALNHFPGNVEKQQAFRGLFLAIAKNPNAMVKDFPYLCEALVNFESAEADLKELAQKLIVNFKMIAGNVWFSYFENFPKELQLKMRQKFGV